MGVDRAWLGCWLFYICFYFIVMGRDQVLPIHILDYTVHNYW